MYTWAQFWLKLCNLVMVHRIADTFWIQFNTSSSAFQFNTAQITWLMAYYGNGTAEVFHMWLIYKMLNSYLSNGSTCAVCNEHSSTYVGAAAAAVGPRPFRTALSEMLLMQQLVDMPLTCSECDRPTAVQSCPCWFYSIFKRLTWSEKSREGTRRCAKTPSQIKMTRENETRRQAPLTSLTESGTAAKGMPHG